MICDGRLYEIAARLWKCKKETEVISDIRRCLTEIYDLDQYQHWLCEGQFQTASHTANRFQIPWNIGTSTTKTRMPLLEEFSIVSGDELLVKIEKHCGEIHLTDGNWVDSHKRVFSFNDESELLINWARNKGFLDSVDLVIDPACGCGHHAMGFGKGVFKICSDVNARALAYGKINATLAGDDKRYFEHFDIYDGIHPLARRVRSEHTVLLINAPFVVYPQHPRIKKLIAQDGGVYGHDLMKAAIKSVVNFFMDNNAKKSNAAILCYTLGNTETDRWDVLDYFDSLGVPLNKNLTLLRDQKLWRVNGRKEQQNPMPLSALKLKGSCYHSYDKEDFEWAIEGYQKIEMELRSKGFSHIGYGILEISKG